MDTQSQEIKDIVAALSKAQSQITVAVYDSANPHFKSKYASYEAIRKACVEPLCKNGLSITHHLDVLPSGERMMVTQLSHISGQWMRSFLKLPQEKETPQAVGSGITYAKRYTLGALLAISSDEDDDGEKAENNYRQPQAAQSPKEHVQLIGKDGAAALEKMIHPDDVEYRRNLLEWAYGEEQLTLQDRFDMIPVTRYNALIKSIQNRIEIRKKKIPHEALDHN